MITLENEKGFRNYKITFTNIIVKGIILDTTIFYNSNSSMNKIK